MYPKVESEFTVKTERGGQTTLFMLVLICVLALAEIGSHISQNRQVKEHISVDTTLGKRIRVDLNITFPALACQDLHVDAMDAAGDSQNDVDDTFVKKQLHLDGTDRTAQEIEVEMNAHRKKQEEKEKILKAKLPDDYCGPCYGASELPDSCCQTCEDVEKAYRGKRWRTDMVIYTAEQCVREGRDKQKPKKMSKGQGCNLSGYMTVNRVAGNFHIAMGEGLERDGRHIHSFLPEDTPNFNTSHIIHELSFGPLLEDATLNGVTKIVTEETGTTGMFQYFIKVVPTTYKTVTEQQLKSLELPANQLSEEGLLETNRYFFTERFRPLITDLDDMERDELGKVESHGGGVHGQHHGHADHHHTQNPILPGVFFMYEIYPFAVEISPNSVPFSHLFVRLLATVGGVFAVFKWFDSFVFHGSSGSSRAKY